MSVHKSLSRAGTALAPVAAKPGRTANKFWPLLSSGIAAAQQALCTAKSNPQ
jgi:hypothetical protein